MPEVKDELIKIPKQQLSSKLFITALYRGGKQASFVDFEQDKQPQYPFGGRVPQTGGGLASGRTICDAMPTAHQQFIIHTKTGK
jgi:hypothetical protein